MRTVIQRVVRGAVTVAGQEVAAIGRGLVILVGVGEDDSVVTADWLAEKIAHLRIFADEQGKLNLSLRETGGSALVVSQFTLYADVRQGRRPAFTAAASPEKAEPLIEYFVERLRTWGVPTQTGVFRAHMQVEIVNDGPVTIWLEK